MAGLYSIVNLTNVCVSVPLAPEFSNPSYWLPNDRCVPCLDTNLAVNNTKINVNSYGDYIDPSGNSIPFYQVNTIDPEGQLFGNTECGQLNFVRYMDTLN